MTLQLTQLHFAVLALLPFAGCAGLLALVVLCGRSAAFAQFVKYGAIGVLATYVQMGTFYALAATVLKCLGADDWCVTCLGFPAAAVTDGVRAFRFAVATGVGFVLANVFCWLLNRACVFQPGKFRWYVELVMFTGAALLATVIGTALSAGLIRFAGMMTTLAVFVEIVCSFVINFFVRKFVIFKG